jgi:uncharacterized protein
MAVKERALDGQDLKKAFESAKSYLEEHIDEINTLNVFPVPDGDTGINMYLTMESAVKAIEKSDDTSAAAVSATVARGALLGARGNSGVILSQILKGIAKGLEGKKTFSFHDFASSLHIASEQAYRVVADPVEGTILTVIREASETAARTAKRGGSFTRAIGSVVSQAKKTVKRTPEMLPVLKEAGVVDAGGKGLYYVFKGMEGAICRKRVHPKAKKAPSQVPSAKEKERVYGFDVQFMIQGKNLPLEEIRNKVAASGECPLAVGDENLIRVHVHTPYPDDILNYARSKGTLIDVVVEDMDLQVQQKMRNESAKQ